MTVTLPDISGLTPAIRDKIAQFNARPMRRSDDLRILGWYVVLPATQASTDNTQRSA